MKKLSLTVLAGLFVTNASACPPYEYAQIKDWTPEIRADRYCATFTEAMQLLELRGRAIRSNSRYSHKQEAELGAAADVCTKALDLIADVIKTSGAAPPACARPVPSP